MALNQSFGADLRSSFLSVSFSPANTYGEEFNEEDIWGNDEPEVEERETRADSRPAQVEVPALTETGARVLNRTGWHATSSHVSLLTRNRGLSALASEGVLGSGQGPGGGAGDILGSAINITPSVFIPKLASKADALRPIRRASAPVNVPEWSKMPGSSSHRMMAETLDQDDDDEEGSTMVPPHELVARECAKSVSFSVREGVGRTLKGRDLDHIRTAVLRKTGFLDS